MARRITQRDVATAAGVSLSTVSLVFSGSKKPKKATRERVRNVAAELGYRPTPGVSAAMSGRWADRDCAHFSRLAVVKTDDEAQRDFFHTTLLSPHTSFPRQAEEMGYSLEPLDLENMTPVKLRRRLEFLRADGVLFPMVSEIDPELMDILRSWPCVGLIAKVRDSGIPIVYPDLLMSAYTLYEEVIRRCYSRPGVAVAHIPPSRGVVGTIGGFLAAQRNLLPGGPGLFFIEGDDYAAAAAFFRDNDCDAIITGGSGEMTNIEKAWPPARHLGRATLSVIGTNHTGFGYDSRLINERTLKLLDTMIRDNITGRELATLREELRFSWREGDTLPHRR